MIKSLQALKELQDKYDFSIPKTDYRLGIIEKELKALEIIRNKKVNVSLLSCSGWLDFYNQEIAYKEIELTQEEYDLLKEVLL